MSDSRPVYRFPVEPLAFNTVTAALEHEGKERFVDMSIKLQMLARIASGEHLTGFETTLMTLMPTIATVKPSRLPELVAYRDTLQEMGRVCVDKHTQILQEGLADSRQVLDESDMPLLYALYRRDDQVEALTAIDITPARDTGVKYEPARLTAFSGSVAMGASSPWHFICDIAALPDTEMQETVRQYDL